MGLEGHSILVSVKFTKFSSDCKEVINLDFLSPVLFVELK